MKNKRKAYKRYRRSSGDPNAYDAFKRLRTACKIRIRTDYNNFVSYTQNNLTTDNKVFWKFINSKRRDSGLPRSVSLDDARSSDDQHMSNLFATHFQSVYTNCTQNDGRDYSDCHPHISRVATVDVTPDEVFDKLVGLKSSLTPDPDGLPCYFLKMCSPTLAFPVFLLFQKSLKSGIFPKRWKRAYVTPLFKSGDKSDVRNYRPICCLPLLGKILDSIVCDKLMSLFKDTIIPQQHGFFPGRSCQSNLLIYHNYINSSLEAGQQVDSVYTDFCKAFDKVNHHLLLRKLRSYGISGQLFSWLKSYLVDRTQRVKVRNRLSEVINASSGVPQGSHLGPILFSLFVNDISSVFKHCRFLLFADDLKIYLRVENASDCIGLQNDLDNLESWCSLNLMELNISKCKILSFTRKRQSMLYNYRLCSVILERVDSVVDLGITFHRSLCFNLHLEGMLSKANRMIGFIKRQCRDFTSALPLLHLYYTLVRPHLEFCSVIWEPFYNVHISRLENVQKRFVNFVLFKIGIDRRAFDYNERLRLLGVESLRVRRERLSIIYGYKLVSGLSGSPELSALITPRISIYDTRKSERFAIDFYRRNYSQHCPIMTMSRRLNGLPKEINISTCTLNELIKFLKSWRGEVRGGFGSV